MHWHGLHILDVIASLPCYLQCMLNCLKLFFGCMRKQYFCTSHRIRRKNCVYVCSRTHTQKIPGFSLSLTVLIQFLYDALFFNLKCHICHWGIVGTEEAFILPLRFCVAWSFLCSRESWSPESCTSHVLRLLFIWFCMFGSVYLCLSDPRVTPSPASSLPTPYQTRERTLDARMYNSHQFSFSVSLHSR